MKFDPKADLTITEVKTQIDEDCELFEYFLVGADKDDEPSVIAGFLYEPDVRKAAAAIENTYATDSEGVPL